MISDQCEVIKRSVIGIKVSARLRYRSKRNRKGEEADETTSGVKRVSV